MQARSLVFNDIISNDTEATIDVTEFEPKIVEKMIEFCNFDTIENFENEELELFSIATFYKIPSLLVRFLQSTAPCRKSLNLWFTNTIIFRFMRVTK